MYEVTINASDGSLSASSSLSILVSNAVEGRVVDAPLADAAVCLDVNADSSCSEAEGEYRSDEAGYYNLPDTDRETGVVPQVVSIGGTIL